MRNPIIPPTGARLHRLWAVFTDVIHPAVLRAASRRRAFLRHRDGAQEVAAEASALAWAALLRHDSRGIDPSQWPNLVALRAVRHALRGRRLTGRPRVKDVCPTVFDLISARRPLALPAEDGGDGRPDAVAALADDRAHDPARCVPVRLDYAAWLRTQPRPVRRLLAGLARGMTLREAAARCGRRLSWGEVTRRAARASWVSYYGD